MDQEFLRGTRMKLQYGINKTIGLAWVDVLFGIDIFYYFSDGDTNNTTFSDDKFANWR
jgi:hypothetical protein